MARERKEEQKEALHPYEKLPPGQRWLTDRLIAAGYPADPRGVCYGITHMAIMARLAGKEHFKTFMDRLVVISSIPVSEFKHRVESVYQKAARATSKAKLDTFKEMHE